MLAVHLTLDSREQVQIYIRSNWKWYCKQAFYLPEGDSLKTMLWHKKYQLFLSNASGKIQFVEYTLTYHSSNQTCNHAGTKDLAYVAVVDGLTVHLTPLGKFLMPPPMSEK